MTLQALHVAGSQILCADGSVFKAIGTTEFAMFKRFLMGSGWDALVKPILDERRNAAHAGGWDGPLIARVMRNAAPPNEFALDPWSYPMSAVTDFTERLRDEEWYVDWTAGDDQICFPTDPPSEHANPDGPQGVNEHVNQFTAAIVGLPNVIWNQRNEGFKNGGVTMAPPPPWAPPVQYSGNYDPFIGPLACINLHTDRSTEGGVDKWVGKAHESAPYLWVQGKPIFYDEPMGFDEVEQPGRRSTNPHYAAILGSSLSMVSAVYFHSTAGIGSNGFGPTTMSCWQAFCRGAAGAKAL